MKKRIVSTLILWGVLILSLLYGGRPAALGVLLVFGLLTQYEFYLLAEKMGYRTSKIIGLIGGAALLVGAWFQPSCLLDPAIVVVACLILVLSFGQLYIPSYYRHLNAFPGTLWGLAYVPFMLQFYARIVAESSAKGAQDMGLLLVLWSVAIAKFTDVGALLVGKWFGNHLMAPIISPKKTWEGFIGGLLSGIAVGAAFAWKALLPSFPSLSLSTCVAISALISLASIVSDLIESAIKRQAHVKDSGQLIPGIGGAFDLLDSLILSAPISYGLFHYYNLVS